MDKKRIVVALGRNSFGETFPEQQENVKKAAAAIADLVEEKYQIVITHSNGPQVGMIQTAMTTMIQETPEHSMLLKKNRVNSEELSLLHCQSTFMKLMP